MITVYGRKMKHLFILSSTQDFCVYVIFWTIVSQCQVQFLKWENNDCIFETAPLLNRSRTSQNSKLHLIFALDSKVSLDSSSTGLIYLGLCHRGGVTCSSGRQTGGGLYLHWQTPCWTIRSWAQSHSQVEHTLKSWGFHHLKYSPDDQIDCRENPE